MAASLGRADAFDLFRIPDLEPRRGPNVPGWIASEELGLLFLPLAGGPTDRIAAWLEAAGGAAPRSGWTRKSLGRWRADTPGHRSFTVVTHPLQRAHDVFREKIVPTGPDAFTRDPRTSCVVATVSICPRTRRSKPKGTPRGCGPLPRRSCGSSRAISPARPPSAFRRSGPHRRCWSALWPRSRHPT
jgi:hypothetical protein